MLAFFYTREEIGIRLAYWFAFAAVAGACGGIIAFGIQQADLIGSLHGHNWKLLFIVEGQTAPQWCFLKAEISPTKFQVFRHSSLG